MPRLPTGRAADTRHPGGGSAGLIRKTVVVSLESCYTTGVNVAKDNAPSASEAAPKSNAPDQQSSTSGGAAARKAGAAKEGPQFAWKVVGYSQGIPLTLLRAVDRDDADAHLQRYREEGYYSNLGVFPIDERIPLPKEVQLSLAAQLDAASEKRARKPSAKAAGRRTAAAKSPAKPAGTAKAAGKTPAKKAPKPAPKAKTPSPKAKTPSPKAKTRAKAVKKAKAKTATKTKAKAKVAAKTKKTVKKKTVKAATTKKAKTKKATRTKVAKKSAKRSR